jgi:tetratricopeptide (TPR) repeat protein
MNRLRIWPGLVCCSLVLAGCARAGGGPSGEKQAASAQPARPALVMPDQAKCEAFGHVLVEAMSSGRPSMLDRFIDWNALRDTIGAGMEMSSSVRQDFISSMNRSVNKPGGLKDSLASVVTDGSCRLLRIHDEDQQRRALVRSLSGDGALRYFDFVLSQQPDGQVRAVDFYTYQSGELASQTLRRSLLPVLTHENRGLLDRLTGTENDFVRNLDKIQAISTQFRQRKFQEAMLIYEQLPPGLQHEKNLLLLRLRIAQMLSDEQYMAALEALRTTFPRDANVDLLSIDYFLIKKGYARARKCIDRVDAVTGGDPYLDLYRANSYLAEDDFKAAQQAIERLIKQEPDLIHAYWVAVTISLKSEHYAETARLLTIVQRRFNLTIKDLLTVSEYAGFVKSPEYQTWLAEREKQPSAAQPKEKAK